ncbi:hypothetical protein B0H15DRAFT_955342 [Mycena belliarum]|uniref:Uncharacterized protein n=1 Tax=Mycena belliarum TaxID=1033014 RepID=A0AAD6XIA8_9AGAR|nr:hypothetical protein B0H15DRAFT_955589 [Mycena belliae]KAJ7077023.1 hypothetical protein B0H15DRAFT_955342 [Mycena belliae]
MGKDILKGRVTRYSIPFFDRGPELRYDTQDDLDRFFITLRTTRSWIVGSVALSVASVLSDPPGRSNMNVLSPYGQLQEWHHFLVGICGFVVVSESKCEGAYLNEGGKFFVFRHPDRQSLHVTITTSARPHILQLFFAAPNTIQQVAVGAHHIVMPFPVMTSNQEGVRGWRPTDGAHPAVVVEGHESYKVASPLPGAVVLHESTANWTRACGEACPAVDRWAHGLKGIGSCSWGGMDGVDAHVDANLRALGHSRLSFRTGAFCLNEYCVFSGKYKGS